MKKSWILLTLVLILGIGFFSWNYTQKKPQQMILPSTSSNQITYIPLGDSYTIGNGVLEEGRWPNVLTSHLQEAGLDVVLLANPAVSGYRVEDALERELPVVERMKPDFVTVLIGANDNFGGKNSSIYRPELKNFLDALQKLMRNPRNIVLITLPDYSKSPAAAGYNTAGVSESIQEYNQIIKDEAEVRGLKVADIFPVSQTMTGREDYINDGLHPSARGYAKWEKVIYPVVFEVLQNTSNQ